MWLSVNEALLLELYENFSRCLLYQIPAKHVKWFVHCMGKLVYNFMCSRLYCESVAENLISWVLLI